MLSTKISSLLNSELDQSARSTFFADLTDSISNSNLQTSEISSTVVLNNLKKENQMVQVYFLMLLYLPKIFSATHWVNFSLLL